MTEGAGCVPTSDRLDTLPYSERPSERRLSVNSDIAIAIERSPGQWCGSSWSQALFLCSAAPCLAGRGVSCCFFLFRFPSSWAQRQGSRLPSLALVICNPGSLCPSGARGLRLTKPQPSGPVLQRTAHARGEKWAGEIHPPSQPARHAPGADLVWNLALTHGSWGVNAVSYPNSSLGAES